MLDVLLLAEDDAQERFVGTLVLRLAREAGVEISLTYRTVPDGFGGVRREARTLSREIQRGEVRKPDVIVVAIDANCEGIDKRRELIAERVSEDLVDRIVHATADPHVERWMLLDGHAFRSVLGTGCSAPDYKCEKARYKRLLAEAIRAAGSEPLLGGIEYAEDLAAAADLKRTTRQDRGLNQFVSELRRRLAAAGHGLT